MPELQQGVLPPPPARIHFIGIGGIGMSGLARILHTWGYRVSGSDAAANDQTAAMARDGVNIAIGHTMSEEASQADLVVISAAVSGGNPELVAAEQAGTSVIKRAELLGLLANGRRSIAVSGSHGKSTTAGMIVSALTDLGEEPSYVVGAVVAATGLNAAPGSSDVMVVEADEYDRSFLWLQPEIAVVTNVEYDHPDIYPSVDDYEAAFVEFLRGVSPVGVIVIAADDAGSRHVLEQVRQESLARIVTFGEAGSEDWSLSRHGDTWQVRTPGGDRLPLHLAVPGRHNVRNAVAALVALDALGVPSAAAVGALGRYSGIGRRFELKGSACGVTVIDDYAHHPTEVAATIEATRGRYRGRRIWAVFQPHTYSRTKAMLAEFAAALDGADEVMLLDIYPSRETDDLGISSSDLMMLLQRPGAAAAGYRDAAASLRPLVLPGDVVLTLGAGDITRLGPELLGVLAESCPQTAGSPPAAGQGEW